MGLFNGDVVEVKKLKMHNKRFTNYMNMWIDCTLELGSWTQNEKSDHDYMIEVYEAFREHVKQFTFPRTTKQKSGATE